MSFVPLIWIHFSIFYCQKYRMIFATTKCCACGFVALSCNMLEYICCSRCLVWGGGILVLSLCDIKWHRKYWQIADLKWHSILEGIGKVALLRGLSSVPVMYATNATSCICHCFKHSEIFFLLHLNTDCLLKILIFFFLFSPLCCLLMIGLFPVQKYSAIPCIHIWAQLMHSYLTHRAPSDRYNQKDLNYTQIQCDLSHALGASRCT